MFSENHKSLEFSVCSVDPMDIPETMPSNAETKKIPTIIDVELYHMWMEKPPNKSMQSGLGKHVFLNNEQGCAKIRNKHTGTMQSPN